METGGSMSDSQGLFKNHYPEPNEFNSSIPTFLRAKNFKVQLYSEGD